MLGAGLGLAERRVAHGAYRHDPALDRPQSL